jgi:hypothetical protein
MDERKPGRPTTNKKARKLTTTMEPAQYARFVQFASRLGTSQGKAIVALMDYAEHGTPLPEPEQDA